jgi:hypothetical protein
VNNVAGITPEQQRILEAAFKFNEHAFVESQPYLLKSAIRRRLTLVDPAWSMSEPRFISHDGNVVTYAAALTICGVTRYALGSGIVTTTKKVSGKKVEIEGFELDRYVAKAHKTAASDCLPRAALAFDVGSYLKEKDRNQPVTEEWLSKLPQVEQLHWSTVPGTRQEMNEVLKCLGLTWDSVKGNIEPGRTLAGLSETTLSKAQFTLRLFALAQAPAKPTEPAEPKPEASH